MNSWATLYKCLWGISIALLVVVMISFFVPKYRTLKDYQQKRYALQQENSEKEILIRELRRKQELILSDPEFIKKTAKEIGMVEPDGLIFKFSNNVPRSAVSPAVTNRGPTR
jgi:cell division protein FtsL